MFRPKTEVLYAGPAPACFSDTQDYVEWKLLARFPGSSVTRRIKACIDCTPSFQEDMIACGRCENPEVRFKWMSVKLNCRETTRELQGYLPSIVNQIKNNEAKL